MKHRVDHGVYVFYGAMNPQLATKTGFSDEDAEAIKEALRTLFVNDASSARPEGSMEVYKIYWWKHNSPNGQYSSAKVHRLLNVRLKDGVEEPKSIEDYVGLKPAELDGLKCEELDGE
jgi:CRISPR-associated protein Csd2